MKFDRGGVDLSFTLGVRCCLSLITLSTKHALSRTTITVIAPSDVACCCCCCWFGAGCGLPSISYRRSFDRSCLAGLASAVRGAVVVGWFL